MSQLPQTRQSLLLRLGTQSNDAWSEFLEIYEQAIVDYARRRGLQEADARDLTQDVMAAVTRKVDDWEPDPRRGSFRGWLFRVARNMVIDKVRAKARHVAASGDSRVAQILAEQPDNREAESSIFWSDYRRKLMHWAALRIKPEVKESSWQAFWLTAVEGQNAEQVAKKLGMTAGAIYGAKFRIVSRIRKMVARLDDVEAGDKDFLNDLPASF